MSTDSSDVPDVIFNSEPFPHARVPCTRCGESRRSAVMIRNIPGAPHPLNLCAPCLGVALVGGLAFADFRGGKP